MITMVNQSRTRFGVNHRLTRAAERGVSNLDMATLRMKEAIQIMGGPAHLFECGGLE